ncbi:cobaltochelatase subunit CobN [Flavobacterium sp. 7A]|uniref:cobaltochelatase subunit CobN n=1 Tax=Flavobacterium sp. 7A TaxID=2940571 RepID=UPI002225F12C|nr:cobaltochelatase subunit CobN [Flavobacterium sp. 7A]MCW2119686.1 cobaltochelatase CobN [Flavobacterium sp. 7A]
MHLIATIPGGWNPNDDGVFYIEQSPGDLLYLSAADTDLYSMRNAYETLTKTEEALPSLRMANLTYFKQELTIDTYIEEVVSKAKVVVLKLLGGTGYYPYLCEAIVACAAENDIELLFLPGDDTPDLELMQLSTVPLETVDLVWNYLLSGGNQNTKEALKFIFNVTLEGSFAIEDRICLPDLFLYHPKYGQITAPIEQNGKALVLIFGYRSYFLADNLDPMIQLTAALENQGVLAVTLMALSYRDQSIKDQILEVLESVGLSQPIVIVNTTGFSLQSFHQGNEPGLFDALKVPVLQAIMASCNRTTWQEGSFGLPPTDVAMNIALPEVDGKIITTVISFKEAGDKDILTDSEVVRYVAFDEGCLSVAKQAKAWINLAEKKNYDKKIALVVPNYPNKDSRLANGVGLDTPQSTVACLHAMIAAGYDLGSNVPKTSDELIERLTENITNDQDRLHFGKAEIAISEADFYEHYNRIAVGLREKIEMQWGHPTESPNYRNGHFLIPGICLGKIFVSIQPSRGYDIDLQATYHSPDLPPTYAYFAYYIWLQQLYQADAIVHVGKHGNLEWLPGKGLALSPESCFPAAILHEIPHFYPFIINDPGEGTQAKRRTHAVILDHLIPPMTRAENYGDLLRLELLIDEYYESALLDPKRANLIKLKIEKLVSSTNLHSDLNSDGKDIDALLEVIDGYLCELKEAQIRGGLHIFGQYPKGEKLTDLIVALHRLPNTGVSGFTQALANDLTLDFDPLNVVYEQIFNKEVMGILCRTYGQAVETLELHAKNLIDDVLYNELESDKLGPETLAVIEYIKNQTIPKVHATTDEMSNLLTGLNGGYVPAGGSGAPTRGRLDILPTGKNFYSVDVRTIPSQAAYELGVKSAQNIIDRYLQDHGEYPTSIGLSVWGTSTMRTGGDDIAQAFALMGVKPIWSGMNRRVTDFEVLSLLKLNRPRVDVMLRISGFFRDAFPDVISLFNAAVEKVAKLDEEDSMNPLKALFKLEKYEWIEKNISEDKAEEKALYRVFGSKPGAYGAGLQGLIDGKNWETQADLAQVYINWSGYAYHGPKNQGTSAHESFEKRLSKIELVIQNQDNREHDLLDSDDYYQFQGGMNAAVTHIKGSTPETYFGDHSRPENPKIKTLKEELLKVYRSRVVNPKWMQGMRDHGYKGAFEMAATMDYLFAYDATTNLVEDFMYEGITEAYLLNKENNAFIEKHNKWALKDMSERMLEAIQRGLWQNPSLETKKALEDLYLSAEAMLE